MLYVKFGDATVTADSSITSIRLVGGAPWAIATRGHHLETVKLLIEAGAYIVSGENNALMYAVKNGNSRIVKFLIEKGADIDDNRSIISEFLSVEKLPESRHSIIDMINAIIIHEL